MDKFEKALLNYAIAGGYKEIFYNVDMDVCGDDILIKICDRVKGEHKLNVTVQEDAIFATIFCDQYDFAVEVIERLANIANLQLIKIKSK